MALGKFMISLRQDMVDKLAFEAEKRGVKTQELLRAVIVPFWFEYKDRLQIVLPEKPPAILDKVQPIPRARESVAARGFP